MTRESHLLTAEHVRVHFGGVRALDVPRLAIPATGTTAALLMGSNGAGKTTLLDVVSGFVRPTNGTRIRLHAADDAVDITRASRVQRVRAGVVRTFQRPPVFSSLTVGESIFLATRGSGAGGRLVRRSGSVVDAVIDLLEIGHLLPQATAGLPLHSLRRVELARVLATQPRILFLDEPTAGSDDREREHLSRFLSVDLPALVRHLHAEGTYRFASLSSCVITHDMKLAAQLCNGLTPGPVVHILAQGRLRASGSLRDLIQDPELRSSYFGDHGLA